LTSCHICRYARIDYLQDQVNSLDLAHCWASTDTSGHTTAPSAKTAHDQGGSERCEEEPVESSACLKLVASLSWVSGTIGQVVASNVRLVAATVYTKVCSQNDTSDECKDGGEEIQRKKGNWDCQTLHHCRQAAVDKNYP